MSFQNLDEVTLAAEIVVLFCNICRFDSCRTFACDDCAALIQCASTTFRGFPIVRYAIERNCVQSIFELYFHLPLDFLAVSILINNSSQIWSEYGASVKCYIVLGPKYYRTRAKILHL